MKSIRLMLICFTIQFSCNLLSGTVFLQLKPGAGFYTDGYNYSAGLGLRTDLKSLMGFLPEGLFMGVGGYYTGALSSAALNFNGFGGGFEIGYRFPIGEKLLEVSPCVLLGASYLQLGNSLTNVSRMGFLVNPSLTIDLPLGDWFAVGLTLDYRYIPLDLPRGQYYLSDLNMMVSLTFIMGSKQEKQTQSKTEEFSSELSTVLQKNKSQAISVKESGNEIRLNISDVLFEVNSDAIHTEYMETLKAIAEMAKNYSEFSVLIEGFTDDTGDPDYNIKLSEKRARNVSYVFLGAGIPAEKVTFKGRGKDKPLVPNTSDANRAKNRRVEIRFIKM